MPLARVCRTCHQPFTVTDDEFAELHRIALLRQWPEVRPPVHCLPCRMARRAERYRETPGPDESRRCASCGAAFVVSADEREQLAAAGHSRRRRCEACLTAGRR